MRLSPSTLAVLSAGLVALAGCGGGSNEAAETVSTTAPPATTETAPAVVTSTEAVPSQTVVVPPTTTATTTATTTTGDSGGTAPPSATTTTTEAAPTTAGDQPQITLRGDGTARATAADDGQAEIWCDAARQGTYDSQLGTATTLVIAVSGSDQVTRCALER